MNSDTPSAAPPTALERIREFVRREDQPLAVKIFALFIAAGVIFAALWSNPFFQGADVDWQVYFRPATLAMLQGRSPFEVSGYVTPPWLLPLLIPFAILPPKLGYTLHVTVGILVLAFTAYRMSEGKLGNTLILFGSPQVAYMLTIGNPDWFALLGYALPPQIGLVLATIKPQTGIGLVLFWLVESLRRGGIREMFRIFWPLGTLTLISLALYGLWPLRAGEIVGAGWDASIWPHGLPIGLAALVMAFRTRNPRWAIGASPALSPYLAYPSWTAGLLAIAHDRWLLIAAVIGSWLIAIYAFLTAGMGG